MNSCHGEGGHHRPHHGHGHGHHGGGCNCGCGTHTGPVFWSKKKKIEVLEKDLKYLQERRKELEDLIKELKEE